MIVKLLTEHHLEFLSLKGGCRGSSESTHVKCHIVGNLMHWLICVFFFLFFSCVFCVCVCVCVCRCILEQVKFCLTGILS